MNRTWSEMLKDTFSRDLAHIVLLGHAQHVFERVFLKPLWKPSSYISLFYNFFFLVGGAGGKVSEAGNASVLAPSSRWSLEMINR